VRWPRAGRFRAARSPVSAATRNGRLVSMR
jgi:hypothetical protein